LALSSSFNRLEDWAGDLCGTPWRGLLDGVMVVRRPANDGGGQAVARILAAVRGGQSCERPSRLFCFSSWCGHMCENALENVLRTNIELIDAAVELQGSLDATVFELV
jgi:hypothetical protein